MCVCVGGGGGGGGVFVPYFSLRSLAMFPANKVPLEKCDFEIRQLR